MLNMIHMHQIDLQEVIKNLLLLFTTSRNKSFRI